MTDATSTFSLKARAYVKSSTSHNAAVLARDVSSTEVASSCTSTGDASKSKSTSTGGASTCTSRQKLYSSTITSTKYHIFGNGTTHWHTAGSNGAVSHPSAVSGSRKTRSSSGWFFLVGINIFSCHQRFHGFHGGLEHRLADLHCWHIDLLAD